MPQVGGGGGQGKGVTSIVTTSYASTANNVIIVMVHGHGGGVPLSSACSDTAGSTFFQLGNQDNGAGTDTDLWWAIAKGNAVNAITITLSPAPTSATVEVEEYSGFSTVKPPANELNGNSGSDAAPKVTTGLISPTVNDWVVGGAGANGTGTFTMTSPRVQRQTDNTAGGGGASNHGGDIGDTPGTGAVTTLSAVISASETWTAMCVILRAAALPRRTLLGAGL